MNRIILVILAGVCLLIPLVSSAQVKTPRVDFDLNDARRLDEIMAVVDAHYATQNEESDYESKWLKWKRWEWYMSNHLGANGEFVNIPERLWKATQAARVMTDNSNRTVNSNWTSIGPATSPLANPDANFNGVGRVSRVAFHPSSPNTIFIGTPFGGLWKSTNDGTTWTNLTDHLPSLSVSGIVVSHANPDHIFILTGDGDGDFNSAAAIFGLTGVSVGVLKSLDGGNTWQTTGTLPGFANVGPGYQMVQDPNDPDVLIVANSNGIYRTDDAGDNWTLRKTGRVYDVRFKPGNSDTIYATRVGEFLRSTNNGMTWLSNAVFNPPIVNAGRAQLAVSQNAPSTVYFLASPGDTAMFEGLWKSTDTGQTFTRQSNVPNVLGKLDDGSDGADASQYNIGMAAATNDAQKIAVAGFTVWRSINSGVNWLNSTSYREDGSFEYIHPDVHDLQYNPLNHHLYAATDGGLYKSTDHGINWTDLSAGIRTTMFYHMRAWNGSSPKLLAGCHDNGIKYRRTATTAWHHITQADGFDIVFNPLSGEPAYGTANSGVSRYDSDGDNATGVTPVGDSVWFKTIAVHNTRPDTVILGSFDIRYSHDGGDSWTTTGRSGSWAMASCPSKNSKFYAAGGDNSGFGDETNSGVYVSTDIGVTWDTISGNAGFPSTWTKITDIAPNPSNSHTVYVTIGGLGNPTEKVFRSYNSGSTWTNLTDNLPNVAVWCIGVDTDNSLYLGTDIGVFYRSAGMSGWMLWSNGLPNTPVTDIAVQDVYVRCSTFGRGAWQSFKADGCSPALVLFAPLDGDRQYEVDDFISSASDITSGLGTFVSFKAGNRIDLTTGFEVANSSEFVAQTGPCGTGGIPSIWHPGTSEVETIRAQQGTEREIRHAFPLGTIDHIDRTGTTATIDCLVRAEGTIAFRLEQEGSLVATLYQAEMPRGAASVQVDAAGIPPGFYMLVMYNDDRVAHYQEFVVE